MNTEKDYFFRVGPNQTFIRGGDETHHLWTGPNPIYEFAEEGWCLDCSSFAVKRLQNAIEKGLIDLSKDENKNWGFSEWYVNTPQRLLGKRRKAVYWFYIKNGIVKGGAGDEIPSECLALPGFHVIAQWAEIAHPSAYLYGTYGSGRRNKQAAILTKEISDYIGKSHKSVVINGGGKFPKDIGNAIRDTPEKPGLHNFSCLFLKRSPELHGIPESDMGMPLFSKMSKDQKDQFLKLLGYHVSGNDVIVEDTIHAPNEFVKTKRISGPVNGIYTWGDIVKSNWNKCKIKHQFDMGVKANNLLQQSAVPSFADTIGTWYTTGKQLIIRYFDQINKVVYLLVRFLPGCMGPPNKVHGGMIACAFDEAYAGACKNKIHAINNGERKMFFTANLTVNYKLPVECEKTYVIKSFVSESNEIKNKRYKFVIQAEMFDISDENNFTINDLKKNATTFPITNSGTAVFVTAPNHMESTSQYLPEQPFYGPDLTLKVDYFGDIAPFDSFEKQKRFNNDNVDNEDNKKIQTIVSNNKNDYYERNILSDPFPYLGMQEYGGITGIDNRILLSMYNDKDDVRCNGFLYCLKACEGPPQHVHGGCTATILDQIFVFQSYKLLERSRVRPSGTLMLSVDYLSRIPLEALVGIRSWCEKVVARPAFDLGENLYRSKMFMVAEIFSLDNPMEVLARSKTLMIAHGYIVNNARGLYEIEESRM